MPRAKSRRRRLAGPSGFSLVEVVVAMLISCVMVTAVMGVAVTSKQGSAKSTHRQMFDQGIAQISAQLKGYVTGCGCTKAGVCPAAACYMAGPPPIQGPNILRAGSVASWYINGAQGPAGTITDSLGDVWALSCGTHRLTGVLSGSTPNLEAGAYGGFIQYVVSYPVSGSCVGIPTLADTPKIDFTASWTEP